MSDLISSDAPFSPEQLEVLALIVAQIIPASDEYAVPSAADPAILTDIVETLVADEQSVQLARTFIEQVCTHTADVIRVSAEEQAGAVRHVRDRHREATALLVTVTAQCYYRDNRVMASLGMEPRPPFPQGYTVEAGDWSLLDPVRARGEIYRRT